MSSTPFAGGIKFGRKRFLRSDARGCGKVLRRACGFEGGLIMRGIRWEVRPCGSRSRGGSQPGDIFI